MRPTPVAARNDKPLIDKTRAATDTKTNGQIPSRGIAKLDVNPPAKANKTRIIQLGPGVVGLAIERVCNNATLDFIYGVAGRVSNFWIIALCDLI